LKKSNQEAIKNYIARESVTNLEACMLVRRKKMDKKDALPPRAEKKRRSNAVELTEQIDKDVQQALDLPPADLILNVMQSQGLWGEVLKNLNVYDQGMVKRASQGARQRVIGCTAQLESLNLDFRSKPLFFFPAEPRAFQAVVEAYSNVLTRTKSLVVRENPRFLMEAASLFAIIGQRLEVLRLELRDPMYETEGGKSLRDHVPTSIDWKKVFQNGRLREFSFDTAHEDYPEFIFHQIMSTVPDSGAPSPLWDTLETLSFRLPYIHSNDPITTLDTLLTSMGKTRLTSLTLYSLQNASPGFWDSLPAKMPRLTKLCLPQLDLSFHALDRDVFEEEEKNEEEDKYVMKVSIVRWLKSAHARQLEQLVVRSRMTGAMYNRVPYRACVTALTKCVRLRHLEFPLDINASRELISTCLYGLSQLEVLKTATFFNDGWLLSTLFKATPKLQVLRYRSDTPFSDAGKNDVKQDESKFDANWVKQYRSLLDEPSNWKGSMRYKACPRGSDWKMFSRLEVLNLDLYSNQLEAGYWDEFVNLALPTFHNLRFFSVHIFHRQGDTPIVLCSDQLLKALAQNTDLVYLCLDGHVTGSFSDTGIDHLAAHCPELEILQLRLLPPKQWTEPDPNFRVSVHADTIKQLLHNCRRLRHIHFGLAITAVSYTDAILHWGPVAFTRRTSLAMYVTTGAEQQFCRHFVTDWRRNMLDIDNSMYFSSVKYDYLNIVGA
jgi:hypothetical protein